jgi:hypothetical protein
MRRGPRGFALAFDFFAAPDFDFVPEARDAVKSAAVRPPGRQQLQGHEPAQGKEGDKAEMTCIESPES